LCVEIGAGGMATVFLAQCARAGAHRFVALKCIRSEHARNPKFVEMFLDEARVASRVQHPNVCSVLDFSRHHCTYYLAMELLFGQTLTALQRELVAVHDAGDSLARAGLFARIIEHACEGLHAAHETRSNDGEPLEVVHRDVSPDNLFVTCDGNVKVIDFGVAYAADKINATGTGTVKGKCRYLAPEVIGGAPPDRRVDIWGLGVVLWEMLTQRKLFDQPSDAAVLHAIVEQDIVPPSKLCDGTPHALDDIVMRALERDPAKRYQTARELGRSLTRFVADNRLAIATAEIAEIMQTCFPDGIACARQMIRFAEQLDAPARPRASPPALELPTVANPPPVGALARRPASKQAAAGRDSTLARARRAGFGRWLVFAMMVAVIASGATCVCLRKTPVGPESASAEIMPAGYTLEATPAGVDDSGAVMLRVRVVRRQ
jgi:serine/threonine-protein kinase